MKLKLLAFLTLLCGTAEAADLTTQVVFPTGASNIDLNHDGVPDLLVSAAFDNNTSHPSQTLSAFINKNGNWYILPVPDDDGFTWSDFRLAGSSDKIIGFELHNIHGAYFLIRAEKYAADHSSEDLTEEAKIKFSKYRVAESSEEPGAPVFYWQLSGSYITSEPYFDVDEAFKKLDVTAFK
ncbi:carbapenem self-resistance protein CarG family protein [Candidatus Pantoea formicae]|uniref:carbapenem self-resistance protein CarG family protein n=1 Tax=Candidatus Pantoea formicae TaxID=2608355 RepID=UPI003ED946FF